MQQDPGGLDAILSVYSNALGEVSGVVDFLLLFLFLFLYGRRNGRVGRMFIQRCPRALELFPSSGVGGAPVAVALWTRASGSSLPAPAGWINNTYLIGKVPTYFGT